LIRLIIHNNTINTITSKGRTITWMTTKCMFWLNDRIFWWWNVVRIFKGKNKRLFVRILNIFSWRIPWKRRISTKILLFFWCDFDDNLSLIRIFKQMFSFLNLMLYSDGKISKWY
jgi:hypothetical protein